MSILQSEDDLMAAPWRLPTSQTPMKLATQCQPGFDTAREQARQESILKHCDGVTGLQSAVTPAERRMLLEPLQDDRDDREDEAERQRESWHSREAVADRQRDATRDAEHEAEQALLAAVHGNLNVSLPTEGATGALYVYQTGDFLGECSGENKRLLLAACSHAMKNEPLLAAEALRKFVQAVTVEYGQENAGCYL